jgi:hypothetical protein
MNVTYQGVLISRQTCHIQTIDSYFSDSFDNLRMRGTVNLNNEKFRYIVSQELTI